MFVVENMGKFGKLIFDSPCKIFPTNIIQIHKFDLGNTTIYYTLTSEYTVRLWGSLQVTLCSVHCTDLTEDWLFFAL